MIQVVVVDDEPVIARSIKNSIEMCDSDFQVVAMANDGQTGLEYIKEKDPDLLFVDICMPVLGGLELLEELKKDGYEIPAVILSGYQEFEYAKRSITLGVLDYLVKPLNPVTLKGFLNKLKIMLASEQYEKQTDTLKKIFYSAEHISDHMPGFHKDVQFRLVKIVVDAYNFVRNNQFAASDDTAGRPDTAALCSEIFGKHGYWLITGKYENEYLLIIREESGMEKKINRLYEKMKEQASAKHYVTLVNDGKGIVFGEFRGALQRLESCLYHESIFGRSKYITVGNNEQKTGGEKLTAIDCAYMGKLMQRKRQNLLERNIWEILETCQKKECTQADLIQILRTIMRSCCVEEPEFETDFLVNLQLVSSTDYETLYAKVCEVIREYIKFREEPEAAGVEYTIYRIQDYLDEHYREKLMIQEIAEHFGINYSYMCSLFRKYRGMSPNEYLIMKKMERAKKLLKTKEDMSIKDIAELVGYTDQYYFSRMFKTYVKVSPKEYRKNRDGEHKK